MLQGQLPETNDWVMGFVALITKRESQRGGRENSGGSMPFSGGGWREDHFFIQNRAFEGCCIKKELLAIFLRQFLF